MNCIVVESPTKAKRIKAILEKFNPHDKFVVIATCGHLTNLPKSKFGIDPKTLKPDFTWTAPDKNKKLKSFQANNYKFYIATDNDQEGEKIADDVYRLLKLDKSYPNRLLFNEITQQGIIHSWQNPGTLNIQRVQAQITRRLIDRIIGYKLTPLAWREVDKKASIGRVQSMLLFWIVEKENELKEQKIKSSYDIYGHFEYNKKLIKAKYTSEEQINSLQGLRKILKQMYFSSFDRLATIKKYKGAYSQEKKHSSNPLEAYNTLSLQKDIHSKYGLHGYETMKILQKLYEHGKISYIRTKNTYIPKDYTNEINDYIIKRWGKEYVLSGWRKRTHSVTSFKDIEKKTSSLRKEQGLEMARSLSMFSVNTQGSSSVYSLSNEEHSQTQGHESIHPINIDEEALKGEFNDLEQKIYKEIWCRTIASQMVPEQRLEQIFTIELDKKYLFTYSEYIILHKGWKIVYDDSPIIQSEKIFKNINNIDKFLLTKLVGVERVSHPTMLYDYSSIVEKMHKHNIGRPSTFAQHIKNLEQKNEIQMLEKIPVELYEHFPTEYKIVEQDKLQTEHVKEVQLNLNKKIYMSTDLGKRIVDWLKKKYPFLVDVKFQSELEEKLEQIEEGDLQYKEVLRNYYNLF